MEILHQATEDILFADKSVINIETEVNDEECDDSSEAWTTVEEVIGWCHENHAETNNTIECSVHDCWNYH